jgi:hypothetical protein
MAALSISSRFHKFKKKAGLLEDLVLYSAQHTIAADVMEATEDKHRDKTALSPTLQRTTTSATPKSTILVMAPIWCSAMYVEADERS